MQDQDAYTKFWDDFQIFPKLPKFLFQSTTHHLLWAYWLVFIFIFSEFFIDIGTDVRVCVIHNTLRACSFPLTLLDVASARLFIPLVLLIVFVWLFERWQHNVKGIFQKILSPSAFISLKAEDAEKDLEKEYLSFLREYQSALLDKGRTSTRTIYLCVWGFLGLIFFYSPLIVYLEPLNTDFWFNASVMAGRISFFLFAYSLLLLIAIGSWPIGVTGIYLTKLSSKFALVLYPDHPDGGNGLRWLGLFCIELALPLLYFAVVLALGFSFVDVLPNIDPRLILPIKFITPPFIILLTWVANRAFFQTLYGFHDQMVEMQMSASDLYSKHYTSLINRWREILEQTMAASVDDEAKNAKAEAEKAKAQLDIVKQLPNPDNYSTWPLPLVRLQIIAFLSPLLIAAIVPILQAILLKVFHIAL